MKAQKKNLKTKSTAGKLVWSGYWNATGWAAAVYAAAMALVFPFFSTDKYFHILRDRFNFCWASALAAGAIILIITGWYTLRHIKERRDEGLSPIDLSCLREPGAIVSFIKKNVAVMDVFFVSFIIVVILSTVFSEWPKEAFKGTDGRYQGCFLWLCYAISYLVMSRYLKDKDSFLKMLLVSGTIIGVWGITDAVNLDLFGWIKAVKEGQRGSFTSSIGNINTYTALLAVFLGLSGGAFLKENSSKGYSAFYGIAFYISAVGMITGKSDNSVIGMCACLGILAMAAAGDKAAAVKLAVLFLIMMASFGTAGFMLKAMPHPYMDESSGILLGLCLKAKTYIILAVLAGAAAVYGKAGKSAAWKWAPFLLMWIYAVIISLILYAVWEANHGVEREIYTPFLKWLKFSDSWGSSRGMTWRMAVEEIKSFPIIRKLIGTGPETYGIVMERDNYEEMMRISGQLFDSPHNEFLQYLFTTGVFGTVCYYGFLISGIFKKGRAAEAGSRDSFWDLGIWAAVFAYTAASFVNISVPITQAFIILLMGCLRNRRNER